MTYRASKLIIVLALVSIMAAHPSAAAVEIIDGGGETLQLEVSKGKLVRLDAPARTVFVADPEIADIQVKSPRLI